MGLLLDQRPGPLKSEHPQYRVSQTIWCNFGPFINNTHVKAAWLKCSQRNELWVECETLSLIRFLIKMHYLYKPWPASYVWLVWTYNELLEPEKASYRFSPNYLCLPTSSVAYLLQHPFYSVGPYYERYTYVYVGMHVCLFKYLLLASSVFVKILKQDVSIHPDKEFWM